MPWWHVSAPSCPLQQIGAGGQLDYAGFEVMAIWLLRSLTFRSVPKCLIRFGIGLPVSAWLKMKWETCKQVLPSLTHLRAHIQCCDAAGEPIFSSALRGGTSPRVRECVSAWVCVWVRECVGWVGGAQEWCSLLATVRDCHTDKLICLFACFNALATFTIVSHLFQ